MDISGSLWTLHLEYNTCCRPSGAMYRLYSGEEGVDISAEQEIKRVAISVQPLSLHFADLEAGDSPYARTVATLGRKQNKGGAEGRRLERG